MKKKKTAAAKANLKKDEIFLDHKRKKKWVDGSTKIYFMLYARDLFVTHGTQENWIWDCFKETSEENIEVARLSHVCWLDVRGKMKISDLSDETLYEIVYIVKVTNGGSGWELPITLRLSQPNGEVKHRQVSLLDKPRGREWFELSLGTFLAKGGETGEVCFDLFEHGGHWKIGLIIKGVLMRPILSTSSV